MKEFLVRITNISPWLMNKVSEEAMLQMWDKTTKKSKSKGKLSPEEEASNKVYMANLCNAGKLIRLDGKRQLSTNKSSLVPGILCIKEPVLWLRTPDGKDFSKWGIAEWKYDMRFGRNPNGNEGCVIVRPRFDNCGTEFTVSVDESFMPENTFRDLFDKSGNFFGLFDWRPERKGPFGRYRVDKWIEV